jgi:hypothetical protein
MQCHALFLLNINQVTNKIPPAIVKVRVPPASGPGLTRDSTRGWGRQKVSFAAAVLAVELATAANLKVKPVKWL